MHVKIEIFDASDWVATEAVQRHLRRTMQIVLGSATTIDFAVTDQINVRHVSLDEDGTPQTAARRMLAKLAQHDDVDYDTAAQLGIEARDEILGVAAWSGAEDVAWQMVLDILGRRNGGTWQLVTGVRHDGRCPMCLTDMRIEFDPVFARVEQWVCDHCGNTEDPYPSYLEVG